MERMAEEAAKTLQELHRQDPALATRWLNTIDDWSLYVISLTSPFHYALIRPCLEKMPFVVKKVEVLPKCEQKNQRKPALISNSR
jgi:hypothetical protein